MEALYHRLDSGLYKLEDIIDLIEIPGGENLIANLGFSEGFTGRLLKLALSEPRLGEVFWSYKNKVRRHGLLLKAYLISMLIRRSVAGIPFDEALNSLFVSHRLISLYNPLVMAYLYRRAPQHFIELLLKPLINRRPVYEANPVRERSFLYRDAFLFAGLALKGGIAESLYGDYDASRILPVILGDLGSGIDTSIMYAIGSSYLGIVSSVLILLRTSIRALDSIMDDESKFRGMAASPSASILSWYIGAVRKVIEDSYRNSRNAVAILLGSSDERIYGAIGLIIEAYLSRKDLARRIAYDLLSFYNELLYSESLFSGGGDEVVSGILRAVGSLRKFIDEKIMVYLDNIRLGFPSEIKPYSTLLEKLTAHPRAPSWAGELVKAR